MAMKHGIGAIEGLIMKDDNIPNEPPNSAARTPAAARTLQLFEPVVVVGLGATGLSCIRFLVGRGFEVHAVDSALEPSGREKLQREFPHVPLSVGSLDKVAALEKGTLVLSPGVWLGHEAVQTARAAGVEVLGDIELFARVVDAPVVAITGSNGKSTVTTLVAHMLAAAEMDVRVGGNLGPPALELLDGAVPDCYVLELSSFQLETTKSLRASVASVLNLSPDHMDRYCTFDDYVAAKAVVFSGTGAMVINRGQLRPGRAGGFALRAPGSSGQTLARTRARVAGTLRCLAPAGQAQHFKRTGRPGDQRVVRSLSGSHHRCTTGLQGASAPLRSRSRPRRRALD